MSEQATCSCAKRQVFPCQVKAQVNGLERIISFRPGYICEMGPQGHGVHGMDLIFVVKGEKGAIQFLLFTGWMPNWTEYSQPQPYHPIPAELGVHSRAPLYESQAVICRPCQWLGGTCYYLGSVLQAESAFKLFVKEGEEALWKHLEATYNDIFKREGT